MSTPEEQAYELLRWQALGPLQKFDSSFPYSKTWKESSDRALDEWDKKHPYESSPELAAFRELERRGVFSQSDFYSPSKAADGYYTKRLRRYTAEQNQRTSQLLKAGSQDDCSGTPGGSMNASVEIRRRRARARSRRKRS